MLERPKTIDADSAKAIIRAREDVLSSLREADRMTLSSYYEMAHGKAFRGTYVKWERAVAKVEAEIERKLAVFVRLSEGSGYMGW